TRATNPSEPANMPPATTTAVQSRRVCRSRCASASMGSSAASGTIGGAVTGFLLVVMGVGGCIGVATMFLLGRDEPATSLRGSHRAEVLARIAPPGVTPIAALPVSPPAAGDDADWAPDGDDDGDGAVLAPPRPRRLRRYEGEPDT